MQSVGGLRSKKLGFPGEDGILPQGYDIETLPGVPAAGLPHRAHSWPQLHRPLPLSLSGVVSLGAPPTMGWSSRLPTISTNLPTQPRSGGHPLLPTLPLRPQS